MTKEKKRRILEEEDFIDHPKYVNSIKKLIEKYPEGVSNDVIAKCLMLDEEEVEETYKSAIKKLQKSLGV